MIIKSLIERENGSVITLGGDSYHFKPDSDGNHVCEVTNKDHASRLLSISDGFTLHEQPEIEEDTEELEDNQEVESETEEHVPLQVVAPSQDEPEQDEPEQDEPEQDEPEQDEPEQDETNERDQLFAEYEEKFGKKPHPRTGIKKLKEQLGKD